MWHHLLWQQYWTFYSEAPTFFLIHILFSVPHYFISAPFSSIFLPSPLFWFVLSLSNYALIYVLLYQFLNLCLNLSMCCLQHFLSVRTWWASCTVNMRKRERERDLNFALPAQYKSVCVFGHMQASFCDSQDVNLVKCKCTAW